MTTRLAIFDCDGTLVDSQAPICLAMEQAFAAAALAPPPRAQTRRIVGLSLVEAMRRLHPEGEPDLHDRMTEAYKSAFFAMREAGSVDEPLFEGIAEALDALEAGAWLLGVATGKSDRGLGHVLDTHSMANRFVALHTADRHPSKPHPSMIEACIADAGASRETTAMIGDTSFDMEMAKSAGVLAIGVSWGYHAPHDLTAAGADAVATHPRELAALLEEIA